MEDTRTTVGIEGTEDQTTLEDVVTGLMMKEEVTVAQRLSSRHSVAASQRQTSDLLAHLQISTQIYKLLPYATIG